jgi:hypothetical protein
VEGFNLKTRPWILVLAASVLLLIEAAALINTRWVEDDSWYSSKGWTLATEGRIRVPVFPYDPEYVVNVVTTLHWPAGYRTTFMAIWRSTV